MTRRSVLVVLAAAAGALAVVGRRRSRAARVDVFYEDGSMISLERGVPEADRMLAVAETAVSAARAGQ